MFALSNWPRRFRDLGECFSIQLSNKYIHIPFEKKILTLSSLCYIAIYSTEWWLGLKGVLITTPLLIGNANMRHHIPLTVHHVWVGNSMGFPLRVPTNADFVLIFMVITNFGHFDQSAIHFEQ